MISQLKTAASRPTEAASAIEGGESAGKVDFASALKSTLDQVNQTQLQSEQLGNRFVAGDNSVNLSDVMISMQKANITFQATVQVRNRLVSAYTDMMNMQI